VLSADIPKMLPGAKLLINWSGAHLVDPEEWTMIAEGLSSKSIAS
jgi:hypothetical protein